MQVEHDQATVARGQHASPASFGLAPRCLGQPAGAARAQLAPAPSVRGDAQMTGGFIASATGHRQPTGKQVSFDRATRVQLVQSRGHTPGRLQQGGRIVLGFREPAKQQNQLRPRRPPRALLAAEQPQSFGAAVLGQAEVTRRGGRQGRGVQQFGAPSRRAVVPLDSGDGGVDLAQGILAQAGREQHRALVDEQVGDKDPQLIEQRLGMVEMGECGREVTTGVRGQSALLAGGCVVRLLAAFEPQRLHLSVVSVSPRDVAHSEIHRCAPVQGTRFPNQVASTGEQANGGPGVPQGLGIAAQDIADACPTDQDPQARTPRLRSSRASRTDRPRRGCPARTKAAPRLAETSDSRSRSPALRANRRPFLNSSIAFPISPKSLRPARLPGARQRPAPPTDAGPAPHGRRRGPPMAATTPAPAACPDPKPQARCP